jgi:hypothetical protein
MNLGVAPGDHRRRVTAPCWRAIGDELMNLGKRIAGLLVPVVLLGLLTLPVQARAAGNDDEALKQMEASKLTLTAAVDAAETASKGKAIAAHAKIDGKTAEVLVFCVVDGKCKEVPVDIKTKAAGKVADPSAKEEKSEHVTKAKDILKKMDDAKLTLAAAIKAGEDFVKGGKAIAIKPKLDGEKLDFTVHVNAGGKWQQVTVDGKTGKATKAEDAKADKKKDDKKSDKKKDEKKK